MQLLITRSDIAKYKQISKTPHDDKLNEQIMDAQMLDLQPLLGERLYNSIMAAPADFAEILDGGNYNYDNVTYTNYGLKMVLVYYAYSRYSMFGTFIDTPTGFREKQNDNSSPVETSSKKTIYILNREAAAQVWNNVQNYLIRTNQVDYNLCHRPAKTGGMKFTRL